jgi:hypothetical protein
MSIVDDVGAIARRLKEIQREEEGARRLRSIIEEEEGLRPRHLLRREPAREGLTPSRGRLSP